MSFDILTESSSPLLTESGNNLVTQYETPPVPDPCLPADLISEAICLDSCVPRGFQNAIIISLLCQMAETSCDSADLIENAKCVFQCVPRGMEQSIMIYLLCQLVNGGGGGGGCTYLIQGNYGGNVPTDTPTCSPVLAKDLDTGLGWWWNGSAWVG